MSDNPVVVFATFRLAEGKRDAVLEILDDMVEHTRAEPGNEIYDLYSSSGDEGQRFHLFERYRDEEALQAHRDSDHYKRYRATIPDHLAEPIGVVVLSEVDVRGA